MTKDLTKSSRIGRVDDVPGGQNGLPHKVNVLHNGLSRKVNVAHNGLSHKVNMLSYSEI